MKIRPFHHQRPLCAVAVFFGVGVLCGARFAWRPVWYGSGLLACVLAALLLRACGRKCVAGLMGCALFGGMLLSGAAAHPALPPVGKYEVSGVVSADAELREEGRVRCYLENVALHGDAETISGLRAYWTYTTDEEAPFLPLEGEAVSFTAKLYHPSGQMNPYGFDFAMYLHQRGVTVGLTGAREPSATGRPGRGARSLCYQARKWLTGRARAVFGADSALPEAMLLGVKEQLPDETQRAFSETGIAHILAVSGLHVSLLTAALLLPFRGRLSPRGRLLATAIVTALYCALLDFPAPVVRASILMTLWQLRRAARRAPDGLTMLAAAFMLILILRPLDLFSVGFQLSFCAVLGMTAFGAPLRARLSFLRRDGLINAAATTISASVGVAIPCVQAFHRLSLLGLAVSPIACAAVGVLLPVYFALLLIGCVWLPAGQWLAAPVAAATRWLVAGVRRLSALPFASLRLPSLPWYVVLALAVAGVLATRYVVLPARKKALLACVLAVLSLGVWGAAQERGVRYTQLSAGQADAAVICDGRETVVIDTGEYGGDLANYLAAYGRGIDHLVLTHLHGDHCGGVKQLLEAEVSIRAAYLPQGALAAEIDESARALLLALGEAGVPIREIARGDTIQTRRVTLTALWPLRDAVRPGLNANQSALALLCEMDGVRLLTMSDVGQPGEAYAAVPADMLKVAHHGSKTATGAEFLAIVSPQAAVVSANAPGGALPHPDTLERLASAGVFVYNTGVSGAVEAVVREDGFSITPYLRSGDGS